MQLKWFHSFQFAGYYTAIEKGFYQEEGLAVDLRESDPQYDPIDEVLDGKADYAISDTSLILPSLKGAPLILVAQIFQHSPLILLTRKDSGLKTPYDLRNKRVTADFDGKGSAPIKALLSKTLGGLNEVQKLPFSFRYEDLIENKTDAIAAYITDQPFYFEQHGVPVNIINPRDFGIDFYGDNLFTSQQELKNNPARVERMRRATLKGWQYALEHPDEIIQLILQKYNSQNLTRAHLQHEAKETARLINPEQVALGNFEVTRYQEIADIYAQFGFTDETIMSPRLFYHPFQASLTPEEREWLAQHPRIEVGMMKDWPPFDFVDSNGVPGGIGVGFIKALNRRLGGVLVPTPGVWKDMFDRVKTQQLAALMDITPKPSRDPYFNFTESYLQVPHVIIRRKGSDYLYNEEQLSGNTIALERGFGNVRYFSENYPHVEISEYDNTEFALDAVARGEADAYVGNRAVATYLMKREVLLNLETQGRLNRSPSKLTIGIRKDWPILRDILQKALDSLTEADRNAILKPWVTLPDGGPELEYLLNEEERAWLAEHQVIKVAMNPDIAPIGFHDDNGQYQGISKDYLDLLGKDLNIRFEIVKGFNSSETGKNGLTDMSSISNFSGTDSDLSRYTGPYVSLPINIFARRDAAYIGGIENLKSRRSAIVEGDMIETEIHNDHPELNLILVKNPQEGLDLLSSGEVDAFIGNIVTTTYHMNKSGLNNVRIAGNTPYSSDRTLSVRKDWPILVGILQKSLDDIPQYQHEQIFNHWMSIQFEQQINYQLVWQIILGALFIFAMILYWNRRLSQEVVLRKNAEKELIDHQFSLEKQVEDRTREYAHLAQHDTLTGLINRHEFEFRAKRLISNIASDEEEHALCFMDLDQFKIVNDTCGHTAGDELLRQIGKLLQRIVRRHDTLARLGGDEFGVLMEQCTIDQAQRVASSLLQSIQDYQFSWEGQSYRIGVSIGLVAVTQSTPNFSDLLKLADAACYMAKDSGRNRIHVYHPEDTELAQRHGEMQWVSRINHALQEDRFCLYAQPIVPLEEGTDKHFELLIRMIDEDGNIIPPGAFLPAAERYNLIEVLDAWVIKHAFSVLSEHPDFVNQINFISINLSGPSLTNGGFLDFITGVLRKSGIAANKICFEVTETVAISNLAAASTFISILKQIGCRFALDDFGSGLSSFGYLKNLPVDYLKIDGMFVKDMVNDPMDHAMVKSINEIGQVMGMQTIAEFVENDEIKDMLKILGVNYAQGYGIGKPVPFEDLLGGYTMERSGS